MSTSSAFAEPFFWLAIGSSILVFVLGFDVVRGMHSLVRLEEIRPLKTGEGPSISVIIPARDEERHLAAAIESVLAQDYDRLEVIGVNDRSSDRTAEILERAASRNKRLRVISIDTLPEGWLGKNYALQRGGERASGEYLLFADADVIMEHTAVSRAARRMRDEELDHLTIFPRLTLGGPLINILMVAFGLLFVSFVRPWKARDPRSKRSVGVGAFNMVRAEFYRSIGGHEPIALRPDDDLRLAQVIKKKGGRSEALVGTEFLAVEWYRSTRELIRGLMKNSFALANYRVIEVAMITTAQLVLHVWPFVALFVMVGPTRLVNGLIAITLVGLSWGSARMLGWRGAYAFGFPLASLIFVYIIWRATLVTLFTGHISWRSTRYPLAALRANKI